MQRLFSMFPAGVPGVGLLLLRISIAAMLLLAAYPGAQLWDVTWKFLVLVGLAILLCVGLFTPAVCVVSVLIVSLSVPLTADRNTVSIVLSLVTTICLALLGPGAFSVDARLFGRRIVPAL